MSSTRVVRQDFLQIPSASASDLQLHLMDLIVTCAVQIDRHSVASWTDLSADAVVLAVQQDKHGSDQFRILNDRLLSPTDHRVGDQLL